MATMTRTQPAQAGFPLKRHVCALAVMIALGSMGAIADTPKVLVAQGGVARWAGLAAADCGFHGKRYPAVDAVCYYPVDLHAKPGMHEIALYDQDKKQHLGALMVEAVTFPQVDITLPDDTYVHVSAENLERHLAERKRVLALFKQENG